MTRRSWASSPAVRRSMLGNRPRDTPPEIALERALRSRGLRPVRQLHVRTAARPVTVDLAWPRLKVALFVDACFWHACPRHATWPSANARWWKKKLEANRRRDLRQRRRLRQLGWSVVRVWTHEDLGVAADRVRRRFGN